MAGAAAGPTRASALIATILTSGLSQSFSTDGGKTWSELKTGYDADDAVQSSTSRAIQLADGSIVWLISGRHDANHPERIATGVYRSEDRARTFKLVSFVSTDHELWEPTVAQLPGGRLLMLARREGDINFSDDGGRTWTGCATFGISMFNSQLLMLPNGVLACFHGSSEKFGLRVILSKDGGLTWHGPDDTYGYAVDPDAYGYSAPMLLPDGTVYIAYNHTSGIYPADARTAAIWGMRVKVHDGADGIEVLPAPGSMADRGDSTTGLGYIDSRSIDPSPGDQE